MPLIKSKSKKAFEHNVKAEVDSGKPIKQALAISYDVKRRNARKKMAEGGVLDKVVSTVKESFKEPKMKKPGDPGYVSRDLPKEATEKFVKGFTGAKKASGGMIEKMSPKAMESRPDRGFGAIIVKAEGGEVSPEDEIEMEHHNSIAAAIMARRKMAEGGDVTPRYEHEDDIGLADSMVDIDDNAREIPNQYYPRNEDQVLKENYDEDMMDVSQPVDSNEEGDAREDATEDKHDMISQIRRKMNMRRQFKVD